MEIPGNLSGFGPFRLLKEAGRTEVRQPPGTVNGLAPNLWTIPNPLVSDLWPGQGGLKP